MINVSIFFTFVVQRDSMGKYDALMRRADDAFRNFMHRIWADTYEGGNIICFTCGQPFQASQIDVGHIIPRRYLATRYLEHNARPQCIDCNRHKSGASIESKCHPEEVDDLRRIAHNPRFRADSEFFLNIIHSYAGEQN